MPGVEQAAAEEEEADAGEGEHGDDGPDDDESEDEEELDDDFGSEHSEEEMIETLDAKSRDLFAAKFREKQMKDVATLHGQVSLDAFCVGSGVDVKTVLNTPNLYLLYKAST